MADYYDYYATKAVIRYYGRGPKTVEIDDDNKPAGVLGDKPVDPNRWKQPVHEYFANMRLEDPDGGLCPRSVLPFISQYGLLWERPFGSRFQIDVVELIGLQESLRGAWKGNKDALNEILRDAGGDINVSVSAKGIEISTENLWTLVCILFLRDYAEGRTKLCANQDCERGPYFLESRKGQRYCSHPCAVLINVRRFRAGQPPTKGRKRKPTRRNEEPLKKPHRSRGSLKESS